MTHSAAGQTKVLAWAPFLPNTRHSNDQVGMRQKHIASMSRVQTAAQ